MNSRIVALLALILTACGGAPTKEPPTIARQVADRGRQGQSAYAKGDLSRAATFFEQARRDAMRIEDSEGVAVMSINLARVLREAGQAAQALSTLDGVSAWHRQNISTKSLREIELLSAVAQGDLGQRDAALQRVQSLRADCVAACEIAINLDALHARLLLEKGDAAEALKTALAATARFQAQSASSEMANLYRVQGEAQLATGDAASARQSLGKALHIDKALAQPGKIAQSLELLARAAQASGDSDAEKAYRSRLADVQKSLAKEKP